MVDPIATLLMTWLGTYLLHSTLLLGAAWAAGRLFGARAIALRTHLWRAALIGALVTATAQQSGFVTRLPQADLDPRALPGAISDLIRVDEATVHPAAARTLPVTDQRRTADDRATATDPAVPVDASRAAALAPPVAPARSFASTIAARGAAIALGLWILGALFGLARLALLAVLARRELADRVPASPALTAELASLATRHAVRCPRLSVSATLGGPVSLPNGEIVVPEWCLVLAPRQRAALLAHELAHQRHADPQWLSLALVVHRLLWVQPLLGLARRELAALAELEADAWAARAVDDPRALAECLARCAEHLVADRVAVFGAAMADGAAGKSPLLERIDRLLEGVHMTVKQTPWTARVGVMLVLVAGVFLLPGLVTGDREAWAMGGTNIHIDDDADSVTVSISRVGYQAKFEADGKFALNEAETDVASLAAGGEFHLMEKSHGTKHEYKVVAGKDGALVRSYSRDGKAMPIDAAGAKWLASALPQLLRETGFDADQRVGRLLGRGGPGAVFAEIDLIEGDYARATYLGALLAQAKLDPAQLDRALALAGKIGSDYEKRRALGAALTTQQVDAPRSVALLKVAATIGSDYERAELLIAAAEPIAADGAVRDAWLAAAAGIGSDYELRRTLEEGLDEGRGDPQLVTGVLALGARRLGSDFELRSLLVAATPLVGKDRALAAAYLMAAKEIAGDFERREALVALLDDATLDAASLGELLDATAAIGSDFEQTQVLAKLAPKLGGDAALTKRYREIARGLGEFERGEALKALDDSTSL